MNAAEQTGDKRCFNGCGRTARFGYLTCEECERVAAKARETLGTVAYALAHLDEVERLVVDRPST